MTDENDGSSSATNVLHFADTFILKSRVAYSQHFIDQQNFRLQMGGHGESQAHVHSAGIALDRRIDETFDFGEGDDLVELPVYFAAPHAEDRAVQVNVLAPAQLGMKSRADFEQAADATVKFNLAGRGLGDARKDFKQCGFSG